MATKEETVRQKRLVRLKQAAWNAFVSGLARRREQRIDLLDRTVGDLEMPPIEIEYI
jgi:hypothetical protein